MKFAFIAVVSVLPGVTLGYIMPSIFRLFGMRIEGPANKRYKVLSVLLYPLLVAAGVWIIWMWSIELTLIKFFLAVLAATALSMVGTAVRMWEREDEEEKYLHGEGTGY